MESRIPVTQTVQRLLVGASLLYLALPNVLFLLGWVKAWLAVPLSFILLGAVYMACRSTLPRHGLKSRRMMGGCLLLILLSAFAVELISFHGHLPQMGDFYARNPLYHALIQCDWPLQSSQGEYFVYYAAFFLPPALLAKLFPSLNPASLIFLWTFAGIFLSFCLLYLRLKGRVWVMVALLFVWGCLMDWSSTPGIAWRAGFDSRWAVFHYVIQTFASGVLFPSWLTQMMQTFHHAVPLMLATSLIWCRLLPVPHLPFVAALAVLCSPLGSVGLLFVLLVSVLPWLGRSQLWKGKVLCLLKTPTLWCALPLLVVVVCYFSLAESSSFSLSLTRYCMHHGTGALRWWVVYGCSLAVFWLPAYLLLRKTRLARSTLWYAMLALSVLTSFFFVGVANNELIRKASFCFILSLAFLMALWWGHAGRKKRMIACILILLTSFHFAGRMMSFRDYSFAPDVTRKHIRSEWEGHLNHPEHWNYTCFWGRMPAENSPFYREEGEAFHSVLSPFATGKKHSAMGNPLRP